MEIPFSRRLVQRVRTGSPFRINPVAFPFTSTNYDVTLLVFGNGVLHE